MNSAAHWANFEETKAGVLQVQASIPGSAAAGTAIADAVNLAATLAEHVGHYKGARDREVAKTLLELDASIRERDASIRELKDKVRERATAAGVDKVIARAAEAERELRDAFEVERDAFKVQLAELQRKCVAAEMGVRGLQNEDAYLLRMRAPPPDETRHRSPGQRYSDSREATKLQTSPFDDAPARALQFKELPCTPRPVLRLST